MDTEIQFDRVERAAGATACASCRGALLGSYFQANGQVLCGNCAEAVRKMFTGSEGAFLRVLKAIVFGIGGGLVGGAVYTAVLALAHINAALITILIGFLVGKMVRKGSGNRGGVGYQIIAVAITYMIIGFAATASEFFSGKADYSNPVGVILICIIGSFIGPVIGATQSILGGIITFFGLMQAWKLNKGVTVSITGPHALAPAQAPTAPMIEETVSAPVVPPLPTQSA